VKQFISDIVQSSISQYGINIGSRIISGGSNQLRTSDEVNQLKQLFATKTKTNFYNSPNDTKIVNTKFENDYKLTDHQKTKLAMATELILKDIDSIHSEQIKYDFGISAYGILGKVLSAGAKNMSKYEKLINDALKSKPTPNGLPINSAPTNKTLF
jgi:hypothetical protein